MNNQIPYFGAYGYVPAPAKSFNWTAFIVKGAIVIAVLCIIYKVFIEKKKEEEHNSTSNLPKADSKNVEGHPVVKTLIQPYVMNRY